MHEDEYQHLITKLDTLTKKQMVDLRARLLFQIGHKEEGNVEHEDWILQGILQVLRERGLGASIPPNFRIKKSRSFAGFETSCSRIRELLEQAIPNMTVSEQRGIGILSARALADYIQSWGGEPPSLDSLLRHVGQVPSALNECYPGYLESGMLKFILPSRREEAQDERTSQ
jgi:hypothetical protein